MSGSPESPLETFVKSFDHSCGEEKHTVVIFYPHRAEEVFQKFSQTMEIQRKIGESMIQGKKEGVDLTLYRNGKLLIKGLVEEEARRLLADLLRT